MKQPLFLRIYRDGQLLEIKQVQAEQVVFGLNDDVEVPLKDESIAPIHAMIEERESGYFLCDLGSSSGTLHNGRQILDEAINSGDEIQIGPFTIEFYVGVPKPKSKPPRTGAAAPPPAGPAKKDEIYDTPVKPVGNIPSAPTPAKPTATAKPAAVSQTVKPTPTPAPTPKATPQKKIELELDAPSKEVQIELDRKGGGRPQSVTAAPAPQPKPRVESQPKPARASSGGALEAHSAGKHPKNWSKTFAPTSAVKDLRQILKPTKGTVVEVVVAWRERIVDTYHYSEKKTIYVGSHPKNDVILPVFGNASVSHPLLKIEGAARVFITSDLRGELSTGDKAITLAEVIKRGRAEPSGAGYMVTLQQGELIRVDFGDQVSIFVRYVNQAPKPVAAPYLDLTTAEVSGVVGALLLGGLMALYMAVYQPTPQPEEVKPDEPLRRATFLYKPPIEPVQQTPPAPKPEGTKLSDQNREAQVKSPVKQETAAKPKGDPGKASEAAPNKSKSQVVKPTTPNPGTGKSGVQQGVSAQKAKSDAQGGSQQKDVKKLGVLSVFGGKGTQESLSKAYSGAGAVGGMSQNVTGTGASSAVGAGDTPGEGLKEIGKGGSGTATYGIAGVKTQGRGGGVEGYGTGSIGDKKGTTVIPGGAEESFTGTIDREAIRRVILANMRQIKACYDRALNKDPGLHGKILLTWVIIDKGAVRQASVSSSTMNNSEVENCLVSRLKTWRFPEPPPGQEAEVTYPFVFAAQN